MEFTNTKKQYILVIGYKKRKGSIEGVAREKKSELVMVKKSNNLIQSIGKTTLLSNKLFLTSLRKIENRSGVSAREADYYTDIEKTTGTDFAHGLVAEFTNAELRHMIDSKSGSYYNQIEELMDAKSPKSLRNQWVVMIKDAENGLYGSSDVITATLYDDKTGKLLVKFSSEKKIQDELYNLKNNYSLLNYSLMMSFKSIYAYRLYEIMMSRIGYEEGVTKEKKNEYAFNYGVSELKYLLGVLDAYANKDVKNAITSPRPDFDKIEQMVSSDSTMARFADFQRYALLKAKKEIDTITDWIFTYEPIRSGRGGKVIAVELRFTRKKIEKEKERKLSESERMDFIDEMQDKIPFSLKVKELYKIAETSNYTMERVEKAVEVLNATPSVSNVVGFLIDAIKDDYEVPIKKDEVKKNAFNNIEQHDYDFDLIERIINGDTD